MKKVNKKKKNSVNSRAILLISAFVILLISLLTFSWKNVNASTDTDSKESESCTSCKGIDKDTKFNMNISFIKDAVIDYYTNERLPQTVGVKSTLTLGEIIDKKLVHNIVDSNDKSCSLTESYVEVTKYEDEYLFKINLSCSDVNDYVLIHKGCADYCGDNACDVKPVQPEPVPEEKTYEYEYRKTISCVMTDWSEWTDWSTVREKITNTNYKREETKTETKTETETIERKPEIQITYNCDKYEGYELLGTVCVKTNATLLEEDADLNPTTYDCSKYEGYTLVGKKCVKEDTTTEEKPADENPATYNCDKYEGYKLKGTKCVKEEIKTDEKPADENPPVYSCEKYPGYELKGEKCVLESATTDEKPADENPATYNCDKYPGYRLNGDKCVGSTTTHDEVDATPIYKTKTESYSCGTEEYKCGTDSYECGQWVTTTKIVTQCDANFNCKDVPEISSEYVPKTCYKDKMCTRAKTCTREVDYLDGYDCPSGYTLSGSKCVADTIVPVEKTADKNPTTYNCDRYPGYSLNGNKCILQSTTSDEKPADKNPTTYNCNNYPGYTLSGDKCILKSTTTDEKPADKLPTTYNCDKYEGYTLKGNKCVIENKVTDEKPAEKNPTTYNCDKYEGATLSGDKCIIEVTTIDEQPAIENPPTYNCDRYPGYTLVGNKCLKPKCDVCTKEADKEESSVCPEGYEAKGNMCSKTVEKTVDVTYYRYSERSCEGGSTETRWSMNKEDITLLDLGFRRTGKTRLLAINK